MEIHWLDDKDAADLCSLDRAKFAVKKSNRKTILKKHAKDISDTSELHSGRVMAAVGGRWLVKLENSPGHSIQEVVCVVAGVVQSPHENSVLIAVGDIVLIDLTQMNAKFDGVIVQVGERSTRLSRKAAGKQQKEHVIVSNAEQLLIVVSAAEPFYNKRLIDRYLIAAEKGSLDALLCINKIDLMPIELIEEDMSSYKNVGVKISYVSAKTNEGINQLQSMLAQKITVFSGPSGVGKSSLINAIIGENLQTVGSVSEKTWKGKHTTSAMKMLPLPQGGYLIDTPGIREFSVWELEVEELPYYFPEFDSFREYCRFGTCTHTHEPECAVREAVENGKIDVERYVSYVRIAESLHE